MNDWQCCLVREGTSDEALSAVLERLLVSLTGENVTVTPRGDLRGSTSEKYAQLGDERELYDLIFVHRDADRHGYEVRAKEITDLNDSSVVPVIPVRTTETWVLAHLLGDEETRKWLSREKSITVRNLEGLSDPKGVLREVLEKLKVSGRNVNDRDFNKHRRALLSELQPEGPICRLPAWQELEKATRNAAKAVRPYSIRDFPPSAL